MTAGLMRRVSTPGRLRGEKLIPTTKLAPALQQSRRALANVRERDHQPSATRFQRSAQFSNSPQENARDHEPPDERTVKLGKTIRILHDRLPTLLQSPLPQELLSPHINLRLFPSTHPHLPTVSGKIAYTAALWTAPVAWGRFPVLGNVRLIIESERMVRNGGTTTPANMRHEKLIVRWKTCGKSQDKERSELYKGIAASEHADKITDILRGASKDDAFTGLFIFEFDEEGRIATHTIEHSEEGGNWEKMPKVISVTDWLLGRAWGRRQQVEPGLALGYCRNDDKRPPHLRGRGQS